MLIFLMPLFLTFFFVNWSSLLFVFILSFLGVLFLSCEGLFLTVGSLMELDSVGFGLIILSLWVLFLSVLASQYIKNTFNNPVLFMLLVILLMLFLYFSFSFNTFITFYMSFECSVLPVLFMILGWGYQPERVTAGLYLVFYTISASLPLLVLIIYCQSVSASLMGWFVLQHGPLEGFFSVLVFLAFLVKFPMYTLHLWLPKAHVEAPVAGSMILAGVLLKLGGYGVLRAYGLLTKLDFNLICIISAVALTGGFIMGLVCVGQSDMKSIIACSSVVHMSSCVVSLLVMNEWALTGCYLMLLAHGLCSSGLFYLAGLVYLRTNSRSLFVNKGLLNIMPSMSLWWFLLLACNMACPPTVNLMSEIYMITGLLAWSGYASAPLGLMVFMSCCYGMYLFSATQQGKYFFTKQGFEAGVSLDYFILMLHWVPLNMLICYAGFFL